MSDAELITVEGRSGVRLERVLADPPAVVWRAITDRAQLASWFPCDVDVDGGSWVVGAAITFRFPEDVIDMTLHGVVLKVDEPRALSFSWGDDEVLHFELSDLDGGCRLVLVNELAPPHAARNAAGWDVCLEHLVGATRNVAWQPRFERYRSVFEPVIGEQEGPPTGFKGD